MPADLPPEEDRPGVPLAPPLLFVLPLLVGLGIEWLVRTSFVAGWPRWSAGGLVLAAGLALNVGGFFTQKRAGTDPLPDHPSTRIVSHGPYRYTRNPMYVGFALWTAGIAFLVDSLWVLAAVPVGLALIDRIIVTREERYLERKFGDEYLDYKRRVRRWL